MNRLLPNPRYILIPQHFRFFLRFFFHNRESWAEVQLAASVEVVALSFQLAVQLFAETILVEAKGCQGSTQLILERVVIDFPLRHVQHLEQPRLPMAIADSSRAWRSSKRADEEQQKAATAHYSVSPRFLEPRYRPYLLVTIPGQKAPRRTPPKPSRVYHFRSPPILQYTGTKE